MILTVNIRVSYGKVCTPCFVLFCVFLFCFVFLFFVFLQRLRYLPTVPKIKFSTEAHV